MSSQDMRKLMEAINLKNLQSVKLRESWDKMSDEDIESEINKLAKQINALPTNKLVKVYNKTDGADVKVVDGKLVERDKIKITRSEILKRMLEVIDGEDYFKKVKNEISKLESSSVNESKDSKTFDVEKDGKKIGIVWQNSDGNWEGELSKTGMSWEFLTAESKEDAMKSLISELG
jgi:hypothetical protein